MDEPEHKTVAAVERALCLLCAFGPEDRFLSLATLAERTGLYKSTLLRLAQTLMAAGFLGQNQDGLYHAGPAVMALARAYQNAVTPESVIMPLLKELAAATQESAGFQVPAGALRMCLYRVDSPQRLRDHISPGDLLPRDIGAAGKVIAAWTTPLAADSAAHAIRQKLTVCTVGETAIGMAGIACPVFGSDGFLGALTLSGPEARFDAKAVENFFAVLTDAARRATESLGGDLGVFQ